MVDSTMSATAGCATEVGRLPVGKSIGSQPARSATQVGEERRRPATAA
jgi:hypothetical protein